MTPLAKPRSSEAAQVERDRSRDEQKGPAMKNEELRALAEKATAAAGSDNHGGYGRCRGMGQVWVDDGDRSNFYRHGDCPDCSRTPTVEVPADRVLALLDGVERLRGALAKLTEQLGMLYEDNPILCDCVNYDGRAYTSAWLYERLAGVNSAHEAAVALLTTEKKDG